MALFTIDIELDELNEWLSVLRVLEDMGYVDMTETDDRKKIFISHRGAVRYFTTNLNCSGCFYEGDLARSLVLEIMNEGDSE